MIGYFLGPNSPFFWWNRVVWVYYDLGMFVSSWSWHPFFNGPPECSFVFSHLFMTRATLISHCLAPTSRFHCSCIENLRNPGSYIISLEITFFTLRTNILGVPDPQNVDVIHMLPCKCTRFDFSQYFWYFPKWCDTGTGNGSIFTRYTRLYTQENGPSLLYWQPNKTTKNSVANYENYYSQMKTCVHILIGKFVPVLKHVTFWYYGPPMIQY